MPSERWSELVFATQSDGAAVANTTTETTLLPSHASIILPSDTFGELGTTFELQAFGRISTVVTTPGTLTFRLKLGGTGASGTAVAASQAFALTTTAQTNDTWKLTWFLQTRAVGSAAALMHVGQWTAGALNNSTTAPQDSLIPATAPAVGATFDSRQPQQVDVTAQWSVANAANSIQLHLAVLKALN